MHTNTIIRFLCVLVPLWASSSHAANFADCILEKMPGSMNQATTTAVHVTCTKKHPEQFFQIKKGSGRGLFGLVGFADPESCTIKKSRETSHVIAAYRIAAACRCLYGEPEFSGEACEYRPQVWMPAASPEPTPVTVEAPPVSLQPAPALAPAPANASPSPPSPYLSRQIKAANEAANRQPTEWQQRQTQLKADMKVATDRAIANYPYLNTPAGAYAMERIIEKRDELIQKGVYPSLALTQAVNAFADAYQPR